MTHPIWPFFDLRVRTPRLELRYVDDVLGMELAKLAARGIHEPDYMPFRYPWSTVESPRLERNTMQWYWRGRAELSVATWSIEFAVIADGRVAGATALVANDFAVLRQFETGSWLGREFQGLGLGKEMRHASLHLGFAGLGAEFAVTAAWHDNQPSRGVTRSLGYTETGRGRLERSGEPTEMINYRLSRSDWQLRHRNDITIAGLEPCLDILGVAPFDRQGPGDDDRS